MKTLLTALCVLFCCSLAVADVCNCSVTGKCVCRPGTCQCPNCPGRVVSAPRLVHGYPVAAVIPVVVTPVVAAPQPQVYYAPAAPQSSGCYWNGYQYVCPANNTLTKKQQRALRRADERPSLFGSLFGWGE